MRLTPRILAAVSRYREAKTDSDRHSVLQWCRLGEAEGEVLDRFCRNLEEAGPQPGWLVYSSQGVELRLGVMDALLAGLDPTSVNCDALVRVWQPRNLGEEFVLARALEKHMKTRKAAVMEQMPGIVPYREPDEDEGESRDEVDSGPSAEAAYVTLEQRIEEEIDRRRLDLSQPVSGDLKEEIANILGCSSGSVSPALAKIRGRRGIPAPDRKAPVRTLAATENPVANGKPPPPKRIGTERTDRISGALAELAAALLETGLQSVEPKTLRPALRTLALAGLKTAMRSEEEREEETE